MNNTEITTLDLTFDVNDTFKFKKENSKEEELKNTSVEDDFSKARSSIVNIIKIGSNAIEELSYLAKVSQDPSHYEVLAKLIKDLSDTSNKLMETHIQMEKINNKKPKNNAEDITLYFSTADVAKALKEIS